MRLMRSGSLTCWPRWRSTRITKIAVAAPLPTGEVFTGYFGMDTMDKAMIATNVQADATLDAICANGKRIQQAWEDAAEEDEED